MVSFQVSVYFSLFFNSIGICGPINAWTDCGKWNQSTLQWIKSNISVWCGSTFKSVTTTKASKRVLECWKCMYQCALYDWIVRLWNVIGSVCQCFGHASFTIVSHTNLSLLSLWLYLTHSLLTNAGVRKSVTINFRKIFGGNCAPLKLNHIKHKSNTEFRYFEHNLKESERYQMTIVFTHWCMAKTISNAHLIRAARYNISTRNRKLINQTFKLWLLWYFHFIP